MNIIFEKTTSFYPLNHYSSDKRKTANGSESETFGQKRNDILREKNINARNLLESFQPIHSPISIIRFFYLILKRNMI